MINNRQGFDQSDEQRLASKLQNKNNQNQLASTFFVMPEAKPLLSKAIIDIQKPKVLIKQIDIFLQPPEILSSNMCKDLFSTDKTHNCKAPSVKNLTLTTIWDKYVLSQAYTILYLKYYKQEIQELQKRGFKKLKLQLLKLCRSETYLFSTYIVDLSFLSDAGNYLLRNLKPITFQQILSTPLESQIQFDSRFEGGNLFAVFTKKTNNVQGIQQYDLILQNDINSKGFSNWFYFSIRCKKKTTIRFNIVNMQKSHSLFCEGMKAAVFSYRKFQQQKIQWHRDGYAYCYYRNQLRKNSDNDYVYNTLSFCYDVKYEDDVIYLATNLPYSYSKMLKYVESIEKIAKLNTNIYFKKQNVASSISSNICPFITLTWKRDKRKQQKRRRKKIIGVIARQHPSQTVSSYIVQGLINSLVHLSSEGVVQLLQNYIFKIIPMVNVDGVVYGNARCDITGNDINRKWTRNPNKYIYPIVSGVKNIFSRLIQDEYEIDYFIDLHGHSRKLNSFVYGCKTLDDLQSKQTAWILSRLNSKILFEQCEFGLSQIKKDTARGIMSDLVIGKKSMTIQTSFYGYRNVSTKHWEVKDLERIGATVIQAIYAETTKDPKLFNWETLRAQLKQAIEKDKLKPKNVNQRQNSQSSFGSDSDPSQDEMTDKEKAEHFLDPTIAAKIGLNEVKVIKKEQKIIQGKQIEKTEQDKREKYQMIVDGFKQKMQLLFSKKSQSLKPFTQEDRGLRSHKQAQFLSRYSKSTTKILPFKFTQRLQKPSLQKRNRKSVQLVIKKAQKLSTPQLELPKVEIKNNFWSSLKKEYQVLLSERKLKDII